MEPALASGSLLGLEVSVAGPCGLLTSEPPGDLRLLGGDVPQRIDSALAGVLFGPSLAYREPDAHHRGLITLLVSVPSTMLKTCRATAAMMRLSSSA